MDRTSLYGARLPDRRRKPPGERKTYDIKQLWNRNHEILNLSVLGLKAEQVAEIVGVTPATVSNTVNSTLGKRKMAAMRGSRDAETLDMAMRIKKVSEKCLDFLDSAMEDEVYDAEGNLVQVSVSSKIAIARHVLNDLSGLKAPTRIEGRMAHAHLTLDEIEELKVRARRVAEELDAKEVNPG